MPCIWAKVQLSPICKTDIQWAQSLLHSFRILTTTPSPQTTLIRLLLSRISGICHFDAMPTNCTPIVCMVFHLLEDVLDSVTRAFVW